MSAAVSVSQVSTSVSIAPIRTFVQISGSMLIRESSAATGLNIATPFSLGGNRAVAMTATGLNYADNTIESETLGITKFSAGANSTANILFAGELNGFSGLITGESIYLGVSGIITQTPPTAGYLQVLGVAISSTKINIQLQPPIFLG